jgi:hypothetical protein
MIVEYKTNISGLTKTSTGVVINNNKDQFALIKSSKTRARETKQIRAELSQIKRELAELKEIVAKHVIPT